MHSVGIDAGGTTIRIALRSGDGVVQETVVDAAPDGGPDPLVSLLPVLSPGPDSLVAGITKFTRDSVAQRWKTELQAWFPNCRILVLPDWQIAHHGALAGGDGVLVIAGTGSVAVGRRGGQLHRTGGRGWEYGDEGSGAYLTTEIIRRTVRSMDGIAPSTDLTGELISHIGESDPATFAEECRRRSIDEGRGFLVPFLTRQAEDDQPEAVDLFRGAAGWIARICATNAERCGFPTDRPLPYATVGGIFDCGPWTRETFPPLLRRRFPLAYPVDSGQNPVSGALELAASLLAD